MVLNIHGLLWFKPPTKTRNDETVYFPTEQLVKAMMKGIELDFSMLQELFF